MLSTEKVYSTEQAAEYLGVSLATLRHYLYNFDPPPLKADERLGQNLLFSQATLDRFAAWHNPPGLTVDEAAAYLGVSRSWVNYHLFVSKKLRPDGKRGKSHVFTLQTLDAAKSLIK